LIVVPFLTAETIHLRSFVRKWTLPENVDLEALRTHLNDSGHLSVEAPKLLCNLGTGITLVYHVFGCVLDGVHVEVYDDERHTLGTGKSTANINANHQNRYTTCFSGLFNTSSSVYCAGLSTYIRILDPLEKNRARIAVTVLICRDVDDAATKQAATTSGHCSSMHDCMPVA
uniref:SHSP domain-containing protein n=1 Tax=Angiostrongylus cantonensis TaxID=6313 RepID=A0A158PAU3_ANGCA